MRAVRLAGVIALLAWAYGPAVAGEIRGSLFLSERADTASRHRSVFALGRLQRGVSDAVVYVEQIPRGLERSLKHRAGRAAGLAHVAQRRRGFVPRVTAVVAGSSVEFANHDSLYHNTFSVSPACRFDLGRYPPGHVAIVRFDHPGIVNLHCEIHDDSVGYVVVVPNHAFARPDSLGAFRLPKLPAGEYVLHAWQPRRGELSSVLIVPKKGDVRAKLVYRR